MKLSLSKLSLPEFNKKNVFRFVVLPLQVLALVGPFLYLFLYSPTKFGESATCAGAGAAQYERPSLKEMIFEQESWKDKDVKVTAMMEFAPVSEEFYLRDGIFVVPLDVSGCENTEIFTAGPALVDVEGKVIFEEDSPLLVVDDFNETAPNWMYVFFVIAIWAFVFEAAWFFAAFVRRWRKKSA